MRLLAVLLALGAPVCADEAAIEQVWREWVADEGVTRSTIAISRDGESVATFGIGAQADLAVPLASLAKAVTGACIGVLIDEGRLDYSTRLADVFAARPEFPGNGADITVAQLLTHTSGLDYDRTQTALNPTLWGGPDLHDRVSALALGRRLGAQDFYYNNENYAILGSVIMEITGQTVADVCQPRVLGGLASATPDDGTGGGLAWMGWSMAAQDYARFASGLAVQDDWPRAELGRGMYYGPGVVFDYYEGQSDIWHSGAFCVLFLRNYGSYFTVMDNGWTVVVTYDICATAEQEQDLADGIYDAAYFEGR